MQIALSLYSIESNANSEEDEDYKDISFDSYDAEAVKEISPTQETVFDSKMTHLVCPVATKWDTKSNAGIFIWKIINSPL